MLEIAPSIARSLSVGHPLADADADRATSQPAIPSVVYSLAGLHLVFSALPDGQAGPVEHASPSGSATVNEVDLGPVNWAGFGPALAAWGKSRLAGGGMTDATNHTTPHARRTRPAPPTARISHDHQVGSVGTGGQ